MVSSGDSSKSHHVACLSSLVRTEYDLSNIRHEISMSWNECWHIIIYVDDRLLGMLRSIGNNSLPLPLPYLLKSSFTHDSFSICPSLLRYYRTSLSMTSSVLCNSLTKVWLAHLPCIQVQWPGLLLTNLELRIATRSMRRQYRDASIIDESDKIRRILPRGCLFSSARLKLTEEAQREPGNSRVNWLPMGDK